MAIITSINVQEKNKKRCNIFLDGEYFTSLNIETALQNRLKVGLEIDKAMLSDIEKQSNKVDALQLSINYVSKSLKTKKQVKTYLSNKGFSEEIAWFCIDKLQEYGFINDSEYARRYIESTSKTQGKRLVEYKLMMKGLKKDDINSVYDECSVDSRENAFIIAQKHIKNKEQTKENLAKTYRYLIGRGFSYEEANYAMSKLKEDD